MERREWLCMLGEVDGIGIERRWFLETSNSRDDSWIETWIRNLEYAWLLGYEVFLQSEYENEYMIE